MYYIKDDSRKWLVVNKKKYNYRKTLFPKKPSNSNIMYYNSFAKLLLFIIFAMIGFLIFHFVSFDHNKVKIKTIKTIKDRYIIPENIVFLGDSITDFYDLDKYYSDNNVVNSGVNGDVCEDILSDMYNRVYKYNPSKVFLLIGTNQIPIGDDDDKIIDDIKKIIDEIHSNRPIAKIYVESIYPVNDDLNKKVVKNRDNKRISKINKELEKIIKDIDYVEYINVYDKLIDDEKLNKEYTKDGLHLNDKGYEIVTEILKKHID